MQRLAEVVFGMEVVLGERLRPVDEVDLIRPPDAWQRAQTFELVFQTVLALNGAEEDPVLAVLERRLRQTHPPQARGSMRSAMFKIRCKYSIRGLGRTTSWAGPFDVRGRGSVGRSVAGLITDPR